MSNAQHSSLEASPKTSSSRWVFSESAVNFYFAQREAFLRDQTEDKLGLYIGVYRTEDGDPFVFEAVREAERRIQKAQRFKEYEPPLGDSQFRKLAARLMFGEHSSVICEVRRHEFELCSERFFRNVSRVSRRLQVQVRLVSVLHFSVRCYLEKKRIFRILHGDSIE